MNECFYENHIELREAFAELSTVSPEFVPRIRLPEFRRLPKIIKAVGRLFNK